MNNQRLTSAISHLTSDIYRFKALLFPLLVPIAVFCFLYLIYNMCILEGKILECGR